MAAAKSWNEVQREAPIFQTEATAAVVRAVVQDAAVMKGTAGECAAAVQTEEASKVYLYPFGFLQDLTVDDATATITCCSGNGSLILVCLTGQVMSAIHATCKEGKWTVHRLDLTFC